jgi:hypothetical protein
VGSIVGIEDAHNHVYAGIWNDVYYGGADGTINTLNNLQGAGNNNGPLTYQGRLPSSYNMIAYGGAYGQLAVDPSLGGPKGHSGSMMFGVFGGDAENGIAPSQLKSGTYENVVTGVDQSSYKNVFNTSTLITSTYVNGAAFGKNNGIAWMLTDGTYRGATYNGPFGNITDPALIWDLRVLNFGLDLAQPQRGMLERRQQAVRNGLDYDCEQFDKYGVCVSFAARYSGFDPGHDGAGILTISKRIDPNLHIGGFIDARFSSSEVNGVRLNPRLPMMGIFATYSAGPDGTGLQARISAAYERDAANITRENMLGSASQVSGKANVDSYGIAQRVGWGFRIGDGYVVTPYLGIRYTDAKRAGYEESYAAGAVNDPFSYAAYGMHRVTGTVGADLKGHLNNEITYRLGIGLDYDFSNNLDTFAARSALIGDMTYTNGLKAKSSRLFGSAGLGYALTPAGTLTLDGVIRQMDYGNNNAYTILAGYRMAF